MRNFDWYTYGLNKTDFDYTFRLVKTMIEARIVQLENEKCKVANEYASDIACEIISDIAHYGWIDIQYMWHFCLWRLQAIFEGIMTTTYIKRGKKLVGLKTKLDKMKEEGYSISDDEINELLQWAKLRNALSHRPPEQYSPVIIQEDDLIEYIKLLKEITTRWEENRLI